MGWVGGFATADYTLLFRGSDGFLLRYLVSAFPAGLTQQAFGADDWTA